MYNLENKNIRIKVDIVNRQFIFTDKRINKVWKTNPFSNSLNVSIKEYSTDYIHLSIQGEQQFFSVEMTLENEAELVYNITSSPDTIMDTFCFPPAIAAPNKKHYIVQTDSEGLLLPVDDSFYPADQQPFFRCSGGPGMAWIGMVDSNIESGYMHIVETPFDVDLCTERVDGLICFSPVWLSSLQKFSYPRKMRTVFFHKGGYVAQCKHYRPYAWKKHNITTLKSRVQQFPNMKKMLGSVHIYVWDDARTSRFLRKLKASGIDRALILWNSQHTPEPDATFSDTAKELGYSVGNQELLTDIIPESPSRAEKNAKVPYLLNYYPGQFDYLTAKKSDGTVYSNEFGNYTCPLAIREEMKKRIDTMMSRYQPETFFLDVYQANGLYECYDERHPLTREGYARSIVENCQYLEDTYGVYLGSEFGADYGASHGRYAYGMMTLQRTWFGSETVNPGSIYYIGSWRNNQRPSIMLSTRTATPEYHKYCINEYTRIPLYELVYHDAVATSWRWEDCNHHYPELWWKKDLFNILYGNLPLWSIDENCFDSYQHTFIESYKHVVPWLSEICYDEMINHRFLTNDHKIQETEFSSGKKVVVNFGEENYQYLDKIVTAHNYMCY